MALHRTLPATENHPIQSLTYPNATALFAATGFTIDDIGRVALQEDTGALYSLKNYSPIVWSELGGSSALATSISDGLMSKEDKAKLDTVTVPPAFNMASLGIWVGSSPPVSPITYSQWLAGVPGYWGYYNIEEGLVGSIIILQAENTISSSGSFLAQPASGIAAVTQAVNICTSSGLFVDAGAFSGTMAVTQAVNTIASSGTYTLGAVSGTSAITQALNTASASGLMVPAAVSGTSVITQALNTATSSGNFVEAGTFGGTIAVTQGINTSSGSGAFSIPAVSGTSAITQALNVSAGSGAFAGAAGLSVSDTFTRSYSTWSNVTAYTVGNIIKYTASSIERSYVCIQNGTNHIPPSGGTDSWWTFVLEPDWARVGATVQNSFVYSSGVAAIITASLSVNYWSTNAPAANQWAAAPKTPGGGVNGVAAFCGPGVRLSSTALDGYFLANDTFDDFDVLSYPRMNICRMNAGTISTLYTTVEGEITGYTYFKIEASGTGATVTLTLKGSTSLAGTYTTINSYADTSGSRITASNYLGIVGKGRSANPSMTDWAGGEL